MKKYITYIFLIMFLLLNFSFNVQASNYDINVRADKTSVNIGENYNISVTYNGTNKLSSLMFDVILKNTSCTITSSGCNSLHCSLNNINPNTTIVSMICNNTGNAGITISGIKASNINGQNISLKSNYISINTKTPESTGHSTTSSSIVTTEKNNITTKKLTTKKISKKTTTTITQPTTEELITANLEITSSKNLNDLKLKKLKIANYDINFKENKKEYTIKVPDNLEYLEIIALPISNDITLNNVGKVDIIDKDKIIIELSKDDVKENYIINIEREKKKESKFFMPSIFIFGVIIIGTITCLIILNKRNKKHEKEVYLNKIAKEKEDARKLLEEELEITQTFYDLNKRL